MTPSQSHDETAEAGAPVLSLNPIRIAAPGRGNDLAIRLSAPMSGDDLPVILFSHGHGSSRDGYGPLADHWAAQGFVVIQPTHLDSRRLALAPDDPRRPTIWRSRVDDMKRILDALPAILGALPGLAERAAQDRIAVAGHSFGGQTASLLLGARMNAGNGGEGEDLSDGRIGAGLLLASGGKGGDDLSDFARAHLPYLDMSFARLTVPTLVVMGDHDRSPLTRRGPDWFADPFHLAPGARAMLTLFGAEHMLGGISGYEAAETTDEHPGRVALTQAVTTAFLKGEFAADGPDRSALTNLVKDHPLGRLDLK